MEALQASLCIRKDAESIFHHSRGPVKLVQASFGVRKDVEILRGDPAKLVHASLSVQ